MSSPNVASIVRAARRQRRIGPDEKCLLCVYANPVALSRVNRTLLDEHHVSGIANSEDLTVVLCRNCHAEVTEDLRQGGVSMKPPTTIIDRAIQLLKGLQTFWPKVNSAIGDVVLWLEGFAKGLDRDYPAWRDMPEAAGWSVGSVEDEDEHR